MVELLPTATAGGITHLLTGVWDEQWHRRWASLGDFWEEHK